MAAGKVGAKEEGHEFNGGKAVSEQTTQNLR